MSTLKQILLDNSTYDNIPQLSENDLKGIINSVEEWLTQKQLPPCHDKNMVGYQVSCINIFIKGLLSELNEDSNKEEELNHVP